MSERAERAEFHFHSWDESWDSAFTMWWFRRALVPENDSLFITAESIENIFEFQQSVTENGPTVVEVAYPEQPIAALFEASSLVHHRYRNKGSKPRSCIIMAFHLASEDPGSLLPGGEGEQFESLAQTIMSYHEGTEEQRFCYLLRRNNVRAIEAKIWELLDPHHHSTMLDQTALSLSHQDLEQWHTLTIKASSAAQLRFEAGVFLSDSGSNNDNHSQNSPSATSSPSTRPLLTQRLATAMSYNKHGLLDLILYQDNHEETRKSVRKSVWTSSKDHLEEIVAEWLPAIESHQFTLSNVAMPGVIRGEAEAFATLLPTNSTDALQKSLLSTHQLLLDLAESITRCEKMETYVTTSLFLFLTCVPALQVLHPVSRQEGLGTCESFLRTYVAAVLLTERIH